MFGIVRKSFILNPLDCKYRFYPKILSSFSSINSPNRNHITELDFRDTKRAFIAKSTPELLRGYIIFLFCKSNFFVKNNRKLMDLARSIIGKKLFIKFMRSSFFGHFVGGEDRDKIRPIVNVLKKYGVHSILDYSAEKDIDESKAVKSVDLAEVVKEPESRPESALKEFKTSIKFADRSKQVVAARTYIYESESQCDENMEIFINSIDAVKEACDDNGLCAIKLTALGRPQFLVNFCFINYFKLQMSDFIVELQRLFELLTTYETKLNLSNSFRSLDVHEFKQRLNDLGIEINCDYESKWFTLLDVSGDGKVDLLDWSHLNNLERDYAAIFKLKNQNTGKIVQLVPSLTESGISQLKNMIRRIDKIAEHALNTNVRLMVDAEQTYFQPAIRRLTMEMMRKFNKNAPIIWNTYQCYTKVALDQLITDLKMSKIENFAFGAKLVRGAYLEQERARSKEYGYEDPININYEATTKMYETCMETVFKEITERKKGDISVMLASHNEATEFKIVDYFEQICFAQLYGMCDHITFKLGEQGYKVYKYLPYGPVEEVLPYLSRRAQENNAILGGAALERNLIQKEIWRRFKERDIFHKP